MAGPLSRTAKWSLTLIWTFLAIGPGAILGNTLFVWPSETGPAVVQRVPSLVTWQVVAWISGVLLVWWLAYGSEMSVTAAVPDRTTPLGKDPE